MGAGSQSLFGTPPVVPTEEPRGANCGCMFVTLSSRSLRGGWQAGLNITLIS